MASGGGSGAAAYWASRRSLPAKPGGSAFRAPADMASLCYSTADDPAARPPATKICATIGPASQSVETLRAMLRGGMSLARINLTWGPLDFHRRTLRNLQEATRLESRLCGVIVGTSGRDIPVVGRPMTQLESGWWQHTAPLDVAAGARVTITTRDGAEASGGLLPIAFKEFPGLVSPGDLLYVGRYLTLGSAQGAAAAAAPDPVAPSQLLLRVLQPAGPDVECEALSSAVLDGLVTISHPGGQQQQRQQAEAVAAAVELQAAARAAAAGGEGEEGGGADARGSGGEQWAPLPGGGGGAVPALGRGADGSANYSLPILSQNDISALKSLAATFPDMIDFVAVSYVRCAADIAWARSALEAAGLGAAGIAAEVNTAAALGRFAEILDESNAVIINRGALGLEVPPVKLCPLQKALVLAANLVGKPVAINMLVDSMVGAPRPTRAEATDVANAVLDGVDALQCGAETLRGKFPVEAVSTLARICREAELVFDHQHHYRFLIDSATAAQEVREEEEEDDAIAAAAAAAAAAHPRRAGAHGGARGVSPTPGGGAPPKPRRRHGAAPRAAAGAAGAGASAVLGGERGSSSDLFGTSDEGSDYDNHSRLSSAATSFLPAPVLAHGAGEGALVHPSLLRPVSGAGLDGLAFGAADGAADGAAHGAAGAGAGAAAPAAAHSSGRPPRPPGAAAAHAAAHAADAAGGHTPEKAASGAGAAGAGGMHKVQGSFADVSTALRSMARGVGPSRFGGAPASAHPLGGPTNRPSGISPYDTPQGSPRAGAWRGGAAAHRADARGLRGRAAAAVAAPSSSFGGDGPDEPRAAALALDPGRDLYPRLEAMAASAVRTALKVGANLIVVLSHTSTAARLVSKYRPQQPVLVLMVPRLGVVNGVKWRLEGRGEARRCLMSRGLTPLLWVPHIGSSGGAALDTATAAALRMGLVRPGGHVVCLERFSNSLGVHVIEAGAAAVASAQGSPHGGRAPLITDFFSGVRPRLPGRPSGSATAGAGPCVSVSQLVSSPSVVSPSAVAAAFEMIRQDASAAAAGVALPGTCTDYGDGAGAALAAAEGAAAAGAGAGAAAAAFGAIASGAARPLGGRGALASSAFDAAAGPSPPHVGAFVIPPSPVVGFRSSQLAIYMPFAQPAGGDGVGGGAGSAGGSNGSSAFSGAAGMPAILEAPAASAPRPAAAVALGAAAGAAAAAAAAPGAGAALGGAGAAALGGGLRGGMGMPLVQTLSSIVDDETLMAALELLAPPPAPAAGAPPGGAAAPGPRRGAGGEREGRSQSEVGDGGRGGGGGGGGGGGAQLVRSLSDLQEHQQAAAGAARKAQ